MEVNLVRNEVQTFDNRFMKFEWNYNSYHFYTKGIVNSLDRPFEENH